MATDVSLGGLLLTKEEWDALDDDEQLMLLHAVVDASPRRGFDVPEPYYESYELIYEEKLAS